MRILKKLRKRYNGYIYLPMDQKKYPNGYCNLFKQTLYGVSLSDNLEIKFTIIPKNETKYSDKAQVLLELTGESPYSNTEYKLYGKYTKESEIPEGQVYNNAQYSQYNTSIVLFKNGQCDAKITVKISSMPTSIWNFLLVVTTPDIGSPQSKEITLNWSDVPLTV